jgi:hypothetical protein
MVVEGEGEAFALRDVEVVGLGGLIEETRDAEFAFVLVEGMGADEGAAKAEDAGAGHGVEECASGAVGREEAFGAEDADQAAAMGGAVAARGGKVAGAGDEGGGFGRILANIAFADGGADADRFVPVGPVAAPFEEGRAGDLRHVILAQKAEEAAMGGDGGAAVSAHVDYESQECSPPCPTSGVDCWT